MLTKIPTRLILHAQNKQKYKFNFQENKKTFFHSISPKPQELLPKPQ